MKSQKDEDFTLLESTRGGKEDHRSLLFRRPEGRLTFTAGSDDPVRFLERAEELLDQGYYLAGWFAYEFGYFLEKGLDSLTTGSRGLTVADLGIFTEPAVYNHHRGTWNNTELLPPGPDENPTSSRYSSYRIKKIRPSQDKENYINSIEAIKDYIAGGDTYQVNYTLKLLFDFEGSPEDLYLTLRRNQSVSFGAFIRQGNSRTMSFSPELFFRKKGRICMVRPMKGTIKRGRSLGEDRKIKEFLKSDPKNRSENVMIVDMLRNDLGRISEPGAVHVPSLFDVETYESLHQMTTTVQTTLREDLSLYELFQGLFPCGSVTGAPKIRTMEIINELEEKPRGVYTGAIGFLAPNGEAAFNVPIRTLTLKGDKGEMGIGSGITHDSDPEKEWEECLLKARFLTAPKEDFQLIETMLWQPAEGYWLLKKHLARLNESAVYFEFSFDRQNVNNRLDKEAREFTAAGPRKVRLLLYRDGSMEISSTLLDSTGNDPRRKTLPKITLAGEKVDSSQHTLFHKTTSRNLYNRLYREAVNKGFYDVLFTNQKGELTEGAISNLFIEKDGYYYTPPVECGLLPGIFRQYFLETHTNAAEKVLTSADLYSADTVYLVNSVRGMVEVTLEK
ncbi:MAG: aminodeoxychorismate synthase component I [Desulfurivibrionaceae bacterium]